MVEVLSVFCSVLLDYTKLDYITDEEMCQR